MKDLHQTKLVIHIGAMRTASTYLQDLFNDHSEIHQILKSRFFSYNPYFEKGKDFLNEYLNTSKQLIVDSDENYSLGRFKNRLISHQDADFSFKNELFHLSHDLEKMAQRIHQTYPKAEILMIIRNQKQWIESVYKHDIQHFGVSENFNDFIESELGDSYKQAGDFYNLYQIYASLFGSDKVKVMLFEDIRKKQDFFFQDLSKFLGVILQPKLSAKKNEARSDKLIRINRYINRFAQKKKDRKEKKIYYKLRSFMIKGGNSFSSLVSSKKMMSDTELNDFSRNYINSNKKLAKLIDKEAEMGQYGYY